MEQIQQFDKSEDTIRGELDLFHTQNTDVSVLSSEYFTYFPSANIRNNESTPVEFIIPSSQTHMVDFGPNSHFILCRCKLVKANGDPLGANDKACGCHNTFAALFDSCTIEWNSTIVSRSDSLYNYKKHLIDTLSHSGSFKNSKLQMQLYYPDTKDVLDDTNSGFTKRCSYFKDNKTVELIGTLVDAPITKKYIVSGVDIRIVLKRSPSQFHIDAVSPTTKPTDISPYKLEWESCNLYVRKVVVNPNILAQHQRLLSSHKSFKYPTKFVEMRQFLASKGSQTVLSQPLFRSYMPRFIIVTCVDSDNFHPNILKSPFRFKPFSLSSLKVCVDSVPQTYQNLELNSGDGLALMGYRTIFDCLDVPEIGSDISRDDYLNGSFFVGVDLNPVGGSRGGSTFLATREGNLTVELQYSTPLSNNTVILVAGIFQGQISVDQNRVVTVEGEQH